MRAAAAKLLIVITVIIFLFTLIDTTAVYNSDPISSQNCCPRNVYNDFCDTDKCVYETCCEYTYTDYNFALIPYAVFEKPWTLITAMFLHVDFFHIIFNLLALILFGIYLEKVVGWKNFLLIYFIGGIIGSIIYIPFAVYLKDTYIPMVGASGAVYAIILALMIIRPYDEILKARERGFFYDVFWVYVFGLLGYLPLFFVGMLFLAVALSGILVDFLMGGQSGVANAVHLGGAAAGIIFGFYFRGYYAKDRSVKRHTPSEQIKEYFERQAKKYRGIERHHTPSDKEYEETARSEGARLVRRNIFGRYEYIDADKEKDEDKNEDKNELEIEDEKQRETKQTRQISPANKNSDDELEIVD